MLNLQHPFLAATATGEILLWSAILAILLMVVAGAAMWLRHWSKQTDDLSSVPRQGFTMSDLRQLHKEGKMTDAEYEKAKLLIVGSLKSGNNSADSAMELKSERDATS
jgi:hypothetical protein